ncbi:hypothetical protein BGZ60DRAFT_91495 [Tricladium varicosporioides]|nr:hypothetical protein BGZ60DRAFT_91495 [Hymenoscyphus varicosporioides]
MLKRASRAAPFASLPSNVSSAGPLATRNLIDSEQRVPLLPVGSQTEEVSGMMQVMRCMKVSRMENGLSSLNHPGIETHNLRDEPQCDWDREEGEEEETAHIAWHQRISSIVSQTKDRRLGNARSYAACYVHHGHDHVHIDGQARKVRKVRVLRRPSRVPSLSYMLASG